ncbi:MAG: MlaD family protein [Cocleimonas sp.]
MSNKANPATIGGFIVGAILLAVASILIFSSDALFSQNARFIVVFTESINGLQVGAPIKLYGVQIGHVTEINVERDNEHNMTLIPVTFEVNPKKIKDYVDTDKKLWEYEEVDRLIDSGLRMQLQLGSLLTGQLFIEALFLPNTQVKLRGHNTNFKEIPAIPSNSDEIQKTLRNVLETTKTIDLALLFSNLQKITTNLERITGSKQTESTLTALNTSMHDLQQIMNTLKNDSGLITRDLKSTVKNANKLIVDINKNADSLFADTRQVVASGQTTLEEVNSTLDNVDSLINNNSPISQELQSTLKELARAARSTRVMMDYLERHPDALLYGKDAELSRGRK